MWPAICRTKVRPQAPKAHGGDIEAWIRLPSQRGASEKRRRSVRLGPRHKSGATGLPLKSGLCVFRAQPLACHQQLRGRRGRDHCGIFSLHFSQANWTNEFRKARSRQAGGAHLAQEPRPLGRRADQPDIAETPAPSAARRSRDRAHANGSSPRPARRRARRQARRGSGAWTITTLPGARAEKPRAASRSSGPRTAAAPAPAPAPARHGPRRTDRRRGRFAERSASPPAGRLAFNSSPRRASATTRSIRPSPRFLASATPAPPPRGDRRQFAASRPSKVSIRHCTRPPQHCADPGRATASGGAPPPAPPRAPQARLERRPFQRPAADRAVDAAGRAHHHPRPALARARALNPHKGHQSRRALGLDRLKQTAKGAHPPPQSTPFSDVDRIQDRLGRAGRLEPRLSLGDRAWTASRIAQ